MYRQMAAECRKRAAQASNPSVKSAYQVARGWLLLAEQMDWMDRQEEASRPKDTDEHTPLAVRATCSVCFWQMAQWKSESRSANS
jgi:hypothetical protein